MAQLAWDGGRAPNAGTRRLPHDRHQGSQREARSRLSRVPGRSAASKPSAAVSPTTPSTTMCRSSPSRASTGIRAIFQAFLDAFSEAELDIVTLAAEPGLVLAERIDYFTMNDGRKVVLPGDRRVRGREWQDHAVQRLFRSRGLRAAERAEAIDRPLLAGLVFPVIGKGVWEDGDRRCPRSGVDRRTESSRFSSRPFGLFIDRGFHSVKLEDIAEAAGVTARALYRHYDNKQALLAEPIRNGQDSTRTRRRARDHGPSRQSSATAPGSTGPDRSGRRHPRP